LEKKNIYKILLKNIVLLKPEKIVSALLAIWFQADSLDKASSFYDMITFRKVTFTREIGIVLYD